MTAPMVIVLGVTVTVVAVVAVVATTTLTINISRNKRHLAQEARKPADRGSNFGLGESHDSQMLLHGFGREGKCDKLG